MSVINKMLRDLDARGALGPALGPALPGPGAAGTGAIPGAPPSQARRKPARRLALLVLLGASAIGATAFTDIGPLVAQASRQPTPVGMAEVQGDAAAPITVPATAPVAAPVAAPAAPMTPSAQPAQDAAPASPTALRATTTTRTTAGAAPAAPSPRAVPAGAAPLAAPGAAPAALPRSLDAASVPPTPARIDKRALALDPGQRQAQLYRQVVDLAQAGQRQAALVQARELLVLQPRHEAARQLAAHLEQEAGAPGRALALLREGLALEGRHGALALALARLLAAQGLADEALAVLEQHGVAGAEAEGLRAGVLARRGDFAAALPAYEAAARAQPLNPMWWLGLGVALESLGEPMRARQAYVKAQAIGLQRDDLTQYVDQRLRALE